MRLTERELTELALAGIRAQINDLQEKERILEAELRLKQWGKKKKAQLGKHDDPGLFEETRWAVARSHDVRGGELLGQKERKKRKRRLSAAGRRAIAEAARRRWAKVREEQGSEQTKTKARKKR